MVGLRLDRGSLRVRLGKRRLLFRRDGEEDGEVGGGEGRRRGGTARSSHPTDDPELKALLSLCAASASAALTAWGRADWTTGRRQGDLGFPFHSLVVALCGFVPGAPSVVRYLHLPYTSGSGSSSRQRH